MSKFLALAATAAALAGLAAPAVSHAAQIEPQQCTVSIVYSLSNTPRLTYDRTFVVGLDSPYSEDFSTATRFRFFDAFLIDDNGTPVVTIAFDSDVSVFNAVNFTAATKIKDQTKGESDSGSQGFFSSVPGAAGSHITTWTLSCVRAR